MQVSKHTRGRGEKDALLGGEVKKKPLWEGDWHSARDPREVREQDTQLFGGKSIPVAQISSMS